MQAKQKSANKGFTFQPNVCNGCYNFVMMSMNLSNIAILNIKSANCHCVIIFLAKYVYISFKQFSDHLKLL